MDQHSVNVAVRWARSEDARRIAEIHVASWLDTYPGLLPDEVLTRISVDSRERDWHRWLAEGGDRAFTLLAERDGRPVAFCTLSIPGAADDEAEDVAEIPALYAEPAAIGTGVGKLLLEAATSSLRERGFREAVLWMLDGNERAAAFYERRGWHRDGGRRASEWMPGMIGPDEIRWRREL